MSGFGQAITAQENANIGSEAARETADIQKQYGMEGLNNARNIFGYTSSQFNPFIQGGTQAFNTLTKESGPTGSLGRQFTLADFNKDPAYQFDLQQGIQAISNANSVRGGALSGGAQRGLVNYATQQASNEFGNARDYFTRNQQQNFGQLAGLAGMGLNAAGTQANLGERFGEAQMGQLNSIGNVVGAGILGQAKARQQGNTDTAQGLESMASMAFDS